MVGPTLIAQGNFLSQNPELNGICKDPFATEDNSHRFQGLGWAHLWDPFFSLPILVCI